MRTAPAKGANHIVCRMHISYSVWVYTYDYQAHQPENKNKNKKIEKKNRLLCTASLADTDRY